MYKWYNLVAVQADKAGMSIFAAVREVYRNVYWVVLWVRKPSKEKVSQSLYRRYPAKVILRRFDSCSILIDIRSG